VVSELKWYDPKGDHPPWIKALAEVRQRATREGWCYHHVQAIIVAIDQYAEAALGNRDFFLNKPYSIGGAKKRTCHERVARRSDDIWHLICCKLGYTDRWHRSE
jgi:hypothetical protein